MSTDGRIDVGSFVAAVILRSAPRNAAAAGTAAPIDHTRNGAARAPMGWIGLNPATSARRWVLVLRNRGPIDRLTYRPVGAAGERYPSWVRELRGKSGVYVIRDRSSGETLYVGESSAGKLYETMTRHLQRWTRWKSWWRGQYAQSNHDPGVTYDRDRVEVAARVLAAERALDEEARLIRALKPRDNVNLVDADDPPF